MTGFKSKKTAALDEDGMYLVHHTAQEPVQHKSDCAVHNGPAYPAGPCDCGVVNPRLGGVLAQPTSSDYALGYAAGFNDACKKPEQEPVAFINAEQRTFEWAKPTSWHTPTVVNLPRIPLYTTPPQRQWVDLTDEEIESVAKQARSKDHAVTLANKLLKEKNT